MFSSAKFPKIDFTALSETLTDSEKQMLPFVFHQKTGELRKSKVKFAPCTPTKEKQVTEFGNEFTVYRYPTETDKTKANAAYVWRMVVFYCVNKSPYNCMPVGATFDLEGTYTEQKETKAQLDLFLDKILSVIPHTEWHSANRWARALGVG
jgi:hypothetical protein